MSFVTVQGRRIEYVRLPSAHPRKGSPCLVFLHEGLGSVAMWRDFPQQAADATGCEAVVYSRYGYGKSDPITASHDVYYMHDEGLKALPELLDNLGISKPILFGHSDGASISLIHAGGAGRDLAGVIVMAPHLMVEAVCISSIEAAKVAYDNTETRLRERLAKFHANVDSAFRGWNDIWLHPEFLRWNIEEYIPRIQAPILAIQGEDDEYGTMEQIDRIARLAPDVELAKLADCRHSPHKDQPQAVIDAVKEFISRLRGD
ncbi:MAG TPA: alpha/beta hydrolase [Rhodocyclaceae bacterium]|nr:alpha/beta hydrolase [Rhodocyclaceae bacterium]